MYNKYCKTSTGRSISLVKAYAGICLPKDYTSYEDLAKELVRLAAFLFSMGKIFEKIFKIYVRWEEKICYYKQRGKLEVIRWTTAK